MLAGVATGMALGLGVGAIVVYAGLSSLVATLGLSFLLRGLILILTEGKSISLPGLRDSWVYAVFSGSVGGVPVQVFWALLFVALSILLFNRHRFGARVRCVGDNPESAAQMGIDTRRVRVGTFVFMGLGAALAGVFSTMINFTWWPTAGEGYLLPTLAAVFVGGTPTWGGIGTVAGGALGALIVSFIQTGIVASGLSGFYVQFFNGLIIILSLLGHRWNQIRYR
jgi:simple sugar transport system permease protein